MPSSRTERLESREEIEAFLRRDPVLHLYALADLDDALWPLTRWWVRRRGDEIEALVMRFDGLAVPVVYAVARPGHEPTRRLLADVAPELPRQFEANLPVGLPERIGELEPAGGPRECVRMYLPGPGSGAGSTSAEPAARPAARQAPSVERLGPEDREELRRFYAGAYLPGEEDGRFFEDYMLEMGPYYGIREAGRLVSVAGLHVLSETYGVAALGNVATRPEHRGRGLARVAVAALCDELRSRVRIVGLNVHADNGAAIRCYQALRFRPVGSFVEREYRRRSAARGPRG